MHYSQNHLIAEWWIIVYRFSPALLLSFSQDVGQTSGNSLEAFHSPCSFKNESFVSLQTCCRRHGSSRPFILILKVLLCMLILMGFQFQNDQFFFRGSFIRKMKLERKTIFSPVNIWRYYYSGGFLQIVWGMDDE